MIHILIQKTPRYDDNVGIVRYSTKVLVAGSKEKIEALRDRLTYLVTEYISAKNTCDHFRDTMLNDKPYHFMVEKVGEKPKYDHSRNDDPEYRVSHAVAVGLWRDKFNTWKTNHMEEWIARADALTAERYTIFEVVKNVPFLYNIDDMITFNEYVSGPLLGPIFSIEEVTELIDETIVEMENVGDNDRDS